MALCGSSVLLRTQGGEPVGFLSGGRNPSFSQANVLVVAPVVDSGRCEYVVLSAEDYEGLRNPPSGVGGDVNVTADIFVGCLLVLCFIGGWISGAQR